MINCKKCGAFIDEKDSYCPRCGFKNHTETPGENSHVINLSKDDYKEEPADAANSAPAAGYTTGYSAGYSVINGFEQPKDYDALCLVGFILTFFGGSIVSLILCIIGVVKFDERTKKGKGFGIAGIIINSILVALTLIMVIIFICMFLGFAYYWEY